MQSYDVATMVISPHCRQTALEYFLSLDLEKSKILALPQETASVGQSAVPVRGHIGTGGC